MPHINVTVSKINGVPITPELMTLNLKYGEVKSDGVSVYVNLRYPEATVTEYTVSESMPDIYAQISGDPRALNINVEFEDGTSLASPESRIIVGDVLEVNEVGGKANAMIKLSERNQEVTYVFSESHANVWDQISNASGGSAATGVTETTWGDGKKFTTELVLEFDLLPAAAASEALGAQIFRFPAGAHIAWAANMKGVKLTAAGAVASDTPDVGVGSVEATGAVSVLSGTSTFEDYITGQTATDCSGTDVDSGILVPTAGIVTGIALNNSADVKEVFFNIADLWAGADTISVTGKIVLSWEIM